MAEVDRTITVPKVGDRVRDREADDEDAEAVVLEVHIDTPASEHYIPALGKSVADVNREYPEDSPVVTVAYVADIDDSIYTWENIPAQELRGVVEENNIRQYDFPASRLDLLARKTQDGSRQGEQQSQSESNESRDRSTTSSGDGDAIGNTDRKFDLSTVPDTPSRDGTGDERYVRRRTEYLKRVSTLRDDVCEALAWREIGYSRSGIAKRMDTTEGTVKKWMEEIAEAYGEDALETRPQSNPHPDLE